MGWGDELVASGLARGAKDKGHRIAFGFGGQIRWTPQAREIFRNNPNVAPPGSENDEDLRWIPHCVGSRLNTSGIINRTRWKWRPFRPPPGEVFFDEEEIEYGYKHAPSDPFVVMESRVKPLYPNKQWPQDRYREVAAELKRRGLHVVQFTGFALPIPGCGDPIATPSFRKALAVLSHAALYIGGEGGLHHGSAAVGTRAVVIFGGWPDPKSSGYDMHRNLASHDAGCGTIARCSHCRKAMARITSEEVLKAAMEELKTAEAA